MCSFRSEIFWQRGSHDTAGFHLSRREEGTIVCEEKAKVILNLALCVGFPVKCIVAPVLSAQHYFVSL